MPFILERLRRAVAKSTASHPLQLLLASIGHFEHSKSSATVWLRPSAANTRHTDEARAEETASPDRKQRSVQMQSPTEPSALLLQLQKALQEEFHECDQDRRPFQPHLSIGQAKGIQKALELDTEVHKVLQDFCQGSEFSGMGNESVLSAHGHNESKTAWQLPWLAERIYVVERHGFHGRFKIVGEVPL